jgi:hypothetical protein
MSTKYFFKVFSLSYNQVLIHTSTRLKIFLEISQARKLSMNITIIVN